LIVLCLIWREGFADDLGAETVSLIRIKRLAGPHLKMCRLKMEEQVIDFGNLNLEDAPNVNAQPDLAEQDQGFLGTDQPRIAKLIRTRASWELISRALRSTPRARWILSSTT